jgi:hypothetical protein
MNGCTSCKRQNRWMISQGRKHQEERERKSKRESNIERYIAGQKLALVLVTASTKMRENHFFIVVSPLWHPKNV